ncbi:MAG: asparaginase [Bacilli bacterium]|nr:asparaginase [Bacilli bacterium]
MKKILVVSTGGTISQEHTDTGVAVSNNNAFRGNTFAGVLNSFKEKLNLETIDSITIMNKDSSNMISKDWELIVQAIYDKYDDYDAFVVTHGTNTMGYATAAVSYAIGNLGKPVIFTGSQVSYGIPGSDALMNLENILRVIIEKEELAGVFLIFGSKIITGTRVKKKTEFDYDAFKTFGRLPDIGYLGNTIVFNDMALDRHLYHLGTKSKTKDGLVLRNKFDNNIMSLTEFPGLKSEYIIKLAESGVKGFILRATGAGDPNVAPEGADYPNLREAFSYLREHKIPIVVTTQAPDGVSSMSVNEPGILAKELGAIPAWDMSMETMVTKLSWLIANGYSYEDIQKLMLTSFRGEIDR